jgi:AraC-like DNA-binding protein
MLIPTTPLAGHRKFGADSLDDLAETLTTNLSARFLGSKGDGAIEAEANNFRLPRSDLWFCSYGAPIAVSFSEGSYLRVQLQHAGHGTTRIGKRAVNVTSSQGCISSAAATIDFGPGFQQVVWRVDPQVLTGKLSAITGGALSQNIEFDAALSLDSADAAEFTSILSATLAHISRTPSRSPLVLAELEQLLIVALLSGAKHNLRLLLDRNPPAPAPWQVRRAEEYIQANCGEPIDIESIAAVTGSSVRSIYRAFRASRGYSPADFVKQCRLRKCRDMLLNAEPSATVTAIALACGFGDMSHFSKVFVKAFGETPSAIRRRSRSTQ